MRAVRPEASDQSDHLLTKSARSFILFSGWGVAYAQVLSDRHLGAVLPVVHECPLPGTRGETTTTFVAVAGLVFYCLRPGKDWDKT